jgi:hypothetical protein
MYRCTLPPTHPVKSSSASASHILPLPFRGNVLALALVTTSILTTNFKLDCPQKPCG